MTWNELTAKMTGTNEEVGGKKMTITIRRKIDMYDEGLSRDNYSVNSEVKTSQKSDKVPTFYNYGHKNSAMKKAEDLAKETGEEIVYEEYEKEWVKK